MSPLQPQEPWPSNPVPLPPAARKSKKARGVWISFVGRVVAQFVGATSSVVLGLFLLHHHQNADAAARAQNAQNATPNPVVRTVAHTPGSATIAVTPLRDASNGAVGRGFADALTGALTVDLVKAAGIHVASAPAAGTPGGVAAPTHADYVLDGAVVVDGRQVRVTVSLVDAITREHVWAESFHEPLATVIATQDRIAADITTQLSAIALNGGPAAPVTPRVVHTVAEPPIQATGTLDAAAISLAAPSNESITQ